MAPPPRSSVDKLARRVAKTSKQVVGGGGAPRRTQAERRATTRSALLEAALASLGEDGYANFTTRRVSERAGVSQGTQQHYFASKAEFAVEAMRYAVQEIATEIRQRIDLRDFLKPDAQERLLDEIWRIHQGRAFKAGLELWIAARTDEDLRKAVRKLERELSRMIGDAAREAVDDEQPDPVVFELLDLALATVRGHAMLAPVVPRATLERRWETTRAHLVVLLRDHLEANGSGAGS